MTARPLPIMEPERSLSIAASAGTGKTWMLVSRIVRLLLRDVRPDAILAITFTRKAAAEMQARLGERLYHLAAADDRALRAELETLGVAPDDAVMGRARHLYERLLRSERTVRFSTFHAFCQDILRRFPLEADVPPGFELIEGTGLLTREAWDAMAGEATGDPEGGLAQALGVLFSTCDGLENTAQALNGFLAHRSDWWAYTAERDRPAAWAAEQLERQLGVHADDDPRGTFFHDLNVHALREFSDLLARHPNATNRNHMHDIERALDETLNISERFDRAARVFLTGGGELRKRKPSKTQAEKMGIAGEARLLALHERLGTQLLLAIDHLKKLATLTTNRAWYFAGDCYIRHYQRLKAEQRLLDFTDLEWKAWRLLTASDNAHWVQYKLDQRIDHLLVDEFQDTNPIQWRLILPLLEELAAGDPERHRSVFVVGDVKQSIYRFRRADPRLFDTAREWLTGRLAGGTDTLTVSYRSSPAVIEFVNTLFGRGPLHEALPDFQPHATRHTQLWGKVEVLPLVTADPAEPAGTHSGTHSIDHHLRAIDDLLREPVDFRQPLTAPRIVAEDQRFYREGRLIAGRIRELVDTPVMLGSAEAARPAGYSDVVILVRNRTHVQAYEKALRDAGIPCRGENRGTLMDCLEIQDMIRLLQTLVAPYDDLALAGVLRSPLFNCSDDDLIRLAQCIPGENDKEEKPGLWINRLRRIAIDEPESSVLCHAWRRLDAWSALTRRLPVHDLLDRIYSEGDVLERYRAAFPPHLRSRVHANLMRFVELALEIDSGRYPSLARFLDRLQRLGANGDDAPDEAPPVNAGGSVRIMTVHGAKGLEAPVVFVADTGSTGKSSAAYCALVDWRPDSDRPDCFLLTGRKDALDSWSRQCLAAEQSHARREEANLLYVALTRARQLLFISACESGRGDDTSWYRQIAACLAPEDPAAIAAGWVHTCGAEPPARKRSSIECVQVTGDCSSIPERRGTRPEVPATPAVMPELARPFTQKMVDRVRTGNDDARAGDIVPSLAVAHDTTHEGAADGTGGAAARLRGTVIHRLLEWRTEHPGADTDPPPASVVNELAGEVDHARLDAWWREARQVCAAPALRHLFDARHYTAAYNEVPVQYLVDGRVIHGVIDRLVITGDEVIVVDYKTGQHATPGDLPRLAQDHREQMRLYREGVSRLWPGKPVRSVLLFTACAAGIEI